MVSSSRLSPYQFIFLLGESILMALGTLLAMYIRLPDVSEIFTWQYSWHRVALVPFVLQISFYYFDLQNFRVKRPFIWTVARVAQAMVVGLMALAVVYYIVPRLFLGRGVMTISFLTISGLVILWRGLYGWALSQRLFSTRVLILGPGGVCDAICEELVSRSDNVYQVVCLVDIAEGMVERDERGEARINLMSYWARLLRSDLRAEDTEILGLVNYYSVNLMVVALDEKRGRMPLEELLRCRMAGVPIMTGEDFFEAVAGRILAEKVKTSWLVFSPTGFSAGALRAFTKRAFDVAVSGLGLIVTSPMILLTALAVRLDSPGPVIYRQRREGQHGRPFEILKFRSMVTEAEKETGPVWSQQDDPRITRVGRIIRKTRLDELPQMWNVFVGQMSFVGPRPERPYFVEALTKKLPFYAERHNVKPGITGWAQVCYPYGASELAALEKLNYDLYYIKHASLSMDLMILAQTLKIILFGGGGR